MTKNVIVIFIIACGLLILLILLKVPYLPEPVPHPNWLAEYATLLIGSLTVLQTGLAVYGLNRKETNLPG